jgi:hypothetical protein
MGRHKLSGQPYGRKFLSVLSAARRSQLWVNFGSHHVLKSETNEFPAAVQQPKPPRCDDAHPKMFQTQFTHMSIEKVEKYRNKYDLRFSKPTPSGV